MASNGTVTEPKNTTPERQSGTTTKELVLGAISLAARLGLAAVWIISGWLKIKDPLQTKQAINAYELFPSDIIPTMATALPALELILGLLLLVGIFLRPVAALSIVIFALFITGIISAWARGLTIDCGCFGGGGNDPNAGPASYLTEIARDTGFIILAAWIIWRPFKKVALHP